MGDRSLAELIGVAATRCRGEIGGRAKEIARLAEVGLFDLARRMTRLSELPLEFLTELSGITVERLIEMHQNDTEEWDRFHEFHWSIALAIAEDPCWQALSAASELADRVDHFLAWQDRAGEGASLAHACRSDTAMLGVLADWLMERQQVRAAQEARHLRGLFESVARDLPAPVEIDYSHYYFDTEEE